MFKLTIKDTNGIFINDIFYKEIFYQWHFPIRWKYKHCNYADNNTLIAFGKTFDEVTRKLQNDFLILDEWFFNNFLVLNSDK